MLNNEKEIMFRFKFVKLDDIRDDIITVYSYNHEYMDMFLTQHTFNSNECVIDCIDSSKTHIDPNAILSPFRFKSNILPGEYVIITTNEIIEDCCLKIAHDLDCKSNLGQAFVYNINNLELFKTIFDLFNKLPYASFIDNPESYDIITSDMINDYLDSYINNPNEAEIFQNLVYINKNNIVNISLEGYISSFTNMIIERFILK